MIIQFNTDKTIHGTQKKQDYYSTVITDELKPYLDHITRIEVHISDENGEKGGPNDIRCLIEARLKGRQPIAFSDQANTMDLSISGAIEQLKSSLATELKGQQDS